MNQIRMITAVTTGTDKNFFVKIQIASRGEAPPRELGITRLQFEILIFFLPVVFLWGLGSTAILIKTIYIDAPKSGALSEVSDAISSTHRPSLGQETKEFPANEDPLPLPVKNSPDQVEEYTKTPVEPKKKITSGIAPSVIAARSFKVDDIFNVDFSIARIPGKTGFSAIIAMKNLKNVAESGRYWFSVLALTKSNKRVWLTSMPEVGINSSGQARYPKSGLSYSFQNYRKSEFLLPKPRTDIVRFEHVMIGFDRDNKTPAIAKAQLMPK